MDVFLKVGFSLLDLYDEIQALYVILVECNISVSWNFTFSILINFIMIVHGKSKLINRSYKVEMGINFRVKFEFENEFLFSII